MPPRIVVGGHGGTVATTRFGTLVDHAGGSIEYRLRRLLEELSLGA